MKLSKNYKNSTCLNPIDLSSVIINLPELVYWKDKNCVYQGCNQNVANLLNLVSTKEIVGKSDYDFGWSQKRIKKLQEVDLAIIQQGISSTIEDMIPVKGLRRILLTSKTPLYDSSGNIVGILGISTDITERKKMEEKLRRSKIAAEAANQAKSSFIANMSHDIRTPLTGVIGMAKMLEENSENEYNRQIAQFLEESGKQLLTMLNNILDVTSTKYINDNVVQNKVFDVCRTIQDVIELERPSALLKGIGLSSDIDPTIPPYLVGDDIKIHRIILNLIGNAIKFTKMGSVTLGLKCIENSATDVSIQMSVVDTGIGIPLEFHNKVFEKFTRGTPSYKGFYKGFGLGLHIVQSYVHALGGRIYFTSEVDKGTTFFVDLTLKRRNSTHKLPHMPQDLISLSVAERSTANKILEAPVQKRHSNDIPSDAPHILLVEDNKVALIMVENNVCKIGCRYFSVVDGESALDLAKTQVFDLIITDLGLPGISGIEWVQNLRSFEQQQKKQAIPIIGLTAHGEGAIKEACLYSGMNEVLSKPITAETMERIKTTYLSSSNKQKLGLGVGLPDTEEELFMLEKFPLFDLKHALNEMGGDCTLLKNFLVSMVNEEIPKDKCAIEKAHAAGDWDRIEKLAHCMKGGFIYCGTPKLVYACQYLEHYHKASHRKFLELLYQQLSAVLDATMQVVNQWLISDVMMV